MPAKSEKQARMFRACGHGADLKVCKKIRKSMSGSQMRDFYHVKSHMPAGATQSPKGDLGERRVKESDAQRGIKNHGGALSGSKAFGSHVGMPGHIGEKE